MGLAGRLRNDITDLSPLSTLTALEGLEVKYNSVSDISALSGLTNLTILHLWNNSISDLAPLITNASSGGLGSGDRVYLRYNPLSEFAQTNQLPVLRDVYGVWVLWP